MKYRIPVLLLALFGALVLQTDAAAQDALLRTFERKALTDVYFSEGANAGDINADGHVDVVYGPWWFAGPDFKKKHRIYEPVPQKREGYADNFFCWIHDFDADGHNDVFVVGFPGTPAYVYENPGPLGRDKDWPKHEVFDWVSNESPQFTNLVGDERPELVCTRDGFFGFASIDREHPFKPWKFHAVSGAVTDKKFGHGLGVGDVNGDGRPDLIHAGGWFEQPLTHARTSRWVARKAKFTEGYGGADMYAYDVDGDGDNDIITGHNAHHFGLGWYEQMGDPKKPTFKHHLIMGEHPWENKYGVVFSEPHSIALEDMDGDGVKDIVTGKTYWSHHRQSPGWDDGAVVYWFKLVRGKDGVDWIPFKADGVAGIGRQVSVVDVNADKLPDIVVGGMVGSHVLIQKTKPASVAAVAAAMPRIYDGPKETDVGDSEGKYGPKFKMDADSKLWPHAIEGEALPVTTSRGGAKIQNMSAFQADRWSGVHQLWWNGGQPGDTLKMELPSFTGTVDISLVMTCAVDYGIVQLSIDDQDLGEPIDLFNRDVVSTGVMSFKKITVTGTKHTLGVKLVGANKQAVKKYMFGLDALRIEKPDGSFVESDPTTFTAKEIKPVSSAGKELNLDFESGTLDDWTATGNAWEGQPIKGNTVTTRRADMRSNHLGEFWIGGFEKSGDKPIGTLTSAPFEVSHRYASFWTNGGETKKTCVELVRKDTGKVIYRVAGNQDEAMRRVVVDLQPFLGKEIMIRLVDDHTGHWGHLNFDHFRFHEQSPGEVTPPLSVLQPDEYPHAGLSAQQAAAAMNLPEGFKVTVGANEPDVKQPIAMAIDERGRVWIAEAYEYPVRAAGDKGRDRILIFEDTDGDGSLDSRKVFHEGLNLVSGIEVGFGGVWVGAAPYLMFIPDRDGDDKPDGEPEILLDGWGFEDTHETLNSFIWGPDGWLYGCHGVFTHSNVGKPGTVAADRTRLNCGVWRYHPVRHEFEVFAHGTSNPWGIDFNEHGQAFITACVIPHLFHVIQGARYQRQAGQHFNPHTYRDITTIADHLHYQGANPWDGNSKSDSVGGGHAHAGAMIYLGGNWPDRYRNQIFMNNIHGQRLNMDVLKVAGSGYVGSHGPDFLLTGDKASQILNLRYGPDGNAWMIDWYDMQACHRAESSVHDRSNGRIYKIAYGEKGSHRRVDLAKLDDLNLAKMVLHDNEWYVRHSRRLLQQRAARKQIAADAVSFLKTTSVQFEDETRRLRALWVLHACGELDDRQVRQLLNDKSEHVRGWTIQLAMESNQAEMPALMIAKFIELAKNDSSPVVRRFLASALQKLPAAQRWELLSALTGHPADASDHNLPLMYWYAAESLAEADPVRALELAIDAGKSIPLLREFMIRRIASSDSPSSLDVLVAGLGKVENPNEQKDFLSAIRTALQGRRKVDAPKNWSNVFKGLLASSNTDVCLQATALGLTFGDRSSINSLRDQARDERSSLESRKVALQSLLDSDRPELIPDLLSMVGQDGPLKSDAIKGLAQFADPRAADALLAAWPNFNPSDRRLALSTLCSRADSGKRLLQAIQAGNVSSKALTADLVQQLRFVGDKDIEKILSEVWGTIRESTADKAKLIADYRQRLESAPSADPGLGRAVFSRTCMKCHMLYGIGEKIGPDLTGSNRSNLDYLLSNILDPSAVMANEYRATVILTDNGRLVSGLIKAEDKKSVTIQTPDAVVVIPVDEIEQRRVGDKSMMPEDQLVSLSDDEIRGLFAYLRGKQQMPMLATAENAAALFNGTDLTGWTGSDDLWSVEDGQIVGRSTGLKENQWLVSDLSIADFKLTVEVKLVGNEGNSGIQFRSRVHDGTVAGYQADIGPGWWGKLYEEHGRGLLSEKSGEEHLKPTWNQYQIVARGNHVQTFLNGKKCVDLKDDAGDRRGIIALQLHSGGATEVRFRNLKLEVLK